MRAKTLAAVVLALVATVGVSFAFVLEGPDERPWVPEEDVDRAPRWSMTQDALATGGERGLGGGLEVSIDESVCRRLTILDRPECPLVRAAVMEAASRWADGHPVLRFTDVSSVIPPAAQGQAPPHRGQGAEIDIFAADAEDFPVFGVPGIGAVTMYYYDVDARPRLANGVVGHASLGVLQAADIRLSAEGCYYLDAAYRRFGCAHLPSLIMHEIGHALGVDHPDERPDRNLDADDDPTNLIAINCMSPSAGLRQSSRLEAGATAAAQVWGDNAWRRGLTNDDIAARDALYPHCDIVPVHRGGGDRWGAFARTENGATMSVIGAASEGEARAQLDAACARRGEPCRTLAAFSSCFAYAEGVGGAAAGATGAAAAEAADRALAICAESGGACTVREAFCAFE